MHMMQTPTTYKTALSNVTYADIQHYQNMFKEGIQKAEDRPCKPNSKSKIINNEIDDNTDQTVVTLNDNVKKKIKLKEIEKI